MLVDDRAQASSHAEHLIHLSKRLHARNSLPFVMGMNYQAMLHAYIGNFGHTLMVATVDKELHPECVHRNNWGNLKLSLVVRVIRVLMRRPDERAHRNFQVRN